jgi:hypothetical protein
MNTLVVNIQVAETPAKVVEREEEPKLIAAVGDAAIGVHYFSGSGVNIGMWAADKLAERIANIRRFSERGRYREWFPAIADKSVPSSYSNLIHDKYRDAVWESGSYDAAIDYEGLEMACMQWRNEGLGCVYSPSGYGCPIVEGREDNARKVTLAGLAVSGSVTADLLLATISRPTSDDTDRARKIIHENLQAARGQFYSKDTDKEAWDSEEVRSFFVNAWSNIEDWKRQCKIMLSGRYTARQRVRDAIAGIPGSRFRSQRGKEPSTGGSKPGSNWSMGMRSHFATGEAVMACNASTVGAKCCEGENVQCRAEGNGEFVCYGCQRPGWWYG